LAVEAQAAAYDPENTDQYVCALCRNGNVHKLNTKLICQNTGCLDLDLKVGCFLPETVMQIVDAKMREHKTHFEELRET
jgi:hypothetical protein